MLTTSEESTGYEKIRKSRMQLYNFRFNGYQYIYIYTKLKGPLRISSSMCVHTCAHPH